MTCLPQNDGRSTQARTVCPICNRTDPEAYETLAVIRHAPIGPYRVRRCRAHGIEFADAESEVHGAAHQTSLDSLYGALDDSRPSRYRDFMDRVEEVATPPGTLHDVGCGNGQLLVEAQYRGWTVQGNDLLESITPGLSARGITYFVGELSRLNLPAATCDVVSSFCVLPHHLTDPLPDLNEVVRILRPSGWLVAELPDNGLYRRLAWAIYRLSRGRLESPLANIYTPGGHVFGYSRRNLKLLLTTCGFERVSFQPYGQPAQLSTARFKDRAKAYRVLAFAATWAISAISQLVGMHNHMVVFAQTSAEDLPTAPDAP